MTELAEALKIAQETTSLKGYLVDFTNEQVSVRDALILSSAGVVVPEAHLFYDDDDIEYDPDIDDVDWEPLPRGMTLDEQMQYAQAYATANENNLDISLNLTDQAAANWVRSNRDQLSNLISRFVLDLYQTRAMLEK